MALVQVDSNMVAIQQTKEWRPKRDLSSWIKEVAAEPLTLAAGAQSGYLVFDLGADWADYSKFTIFDVSFSGVPSLANEIWIPSSIGNGTINYARWSQDGINPDANLRLFSAGMTGVSTIGTGVQPAAATSGVSVVAAGTGLIRAGITNWGSVVPCARYLLFPISTAANGVGRTFISNMQLMKS